MNQDEQNLNLLSLFHYILGPLTVLVSSIFLIHVGMGVAIIRGDFFYTHAKDAPPHEFGWFIVAFGSLVVLCGWTLGTLMIIAGRKLRRRVSRTFCLVVAALECFCSPLGTILGVFTIVVLVKESVIALFPGGPRQEAPSVPQ